MVCYVVLLILLCLMLTFLLVACVAVVIAVDYILTNNASLAYMCVSSWIFNVNYRCCQLISPYI